jgi:glutathione transport system substrate-binding protein
LLGTAGIGAAGLAAAAVVGCSSSDNTATTTATAVASPTSIPNSPLLRSLAESNPQNLDPHANQNNSTNFSSIAHICGHGPMKWDVDGTFKPYFCESEPTVSADGLVITFKFKPGLKFSNGKPLDAAAVIANWEHIQTYSGTAPGGRAFSGKFTFNKVDATTVTVTTEKPFAPIIAEMSFRQELTDMDTYSTTNPIGAGPWILDDWIQNQKLVFHKNPTYFDANRIHFDKMEHIISTDPDAILNAVRTGDWQIGRVPLSRLAEFRGGSELQILEVPSGQVSLGIWINILKDPFTDLRVRQAVDLAIDRNAVKTTVYDGENYPGATMLASNSPFFVQSLHESWKYDVAQATQLIQQAGANGTQITLWAATGTGTNPDDAFATFCKNALEAIGLKVTIQTEEEGALIQDHLFKRDFQAITRYVTGRPDPYQSHAVLNCPGGVVPGTNFTSFCDDVYQTNLNTFLTTFDFQKRYDAFKVCQQRMLDVKPMINTGHIKNNAALVPKLKGYKLHSESSVRYYEDVYLEA